MDKTELRAPGKIERLGWEYSYEYPFGIYVLEWSHQRDCQEHALLWQAKAHEWESAYNADPDNLEAEFVEWLNVRHDNGLFSWQTTHPDAVMFDPDTQEFYRYGDRFPTS